MNHSSAFPAVIPRGWTLMRDDLHAFLAIVTVWLAVIGGISLLTLAVKRGPRDRAYYVEMAATVLVVTLASSCWWWQW